MGSEMCIRDRYRTATINTVFNTEVQRKRINKGRLRVRFTGKIFGSSCTEVTAVVSKHPFQQLAVATAAAATPAV